MLKNTTRNRGEEGESGKRTKANPACEACISKMVRMISWQESQIAEAMKILEDVGAPETMKRIFYAKIRQMDFHYCMAFNTAMNKAGRPFEGYVESFLEAVEESTGLTGLAALEAEPRRGLKMINRTV